VLAVALARHGRVTEAVGLCQATLRDCQRDFLTSAALGLVYAIAGDEDHLRLANEAALAIPAPRSPLNANVAVHYAFLDRADYARSWLAKADREGMRTAVLRQHNALLRGAPAAKLADAHVDRRIDDGAVSHDDQGDAHGKGQSEPARLDQ